MSDKICSKCGNKITNDARFCSYCGKRSDNVCTKCGNKITNGARYCTKCGTRLEKNKIAKKQVMVITACLISAVIVALIISAFVIFVIGQGYTYKKVGNSYEITNCLLFNAEELEVPSEYNGKPVTSIRNNAFSNCSYLTEVTIPDSIREIGSLAFYGCPIEYASVPTIAINAISKGTLKEVVVTSGDIIGTYALYNCYSLTEVTIGDSVTSIGDFAFENCVSLTNITIPSSVISIGDRAFYGCDSLTIYCEAESEPSGWSPRWNYSGVTVVWGYQG